MNQEQLQREFSELYIGKNPVQLVNKYYQKKYRDMLMIILAAIGVIVLCFVNDGKNSRLAEGNRIYRSEVEEQDIVLQMKNQKEDWEEINIRLYPKEYSEDELEEMFLEVCELLPDLILNQKDDLNQVTSDLNLVEEIEGYPFWIRWESFSPEVIDEKGKLLVLSQNYDGTVRLKAVFEYEDWKRDFNISVHVITSKITDFSQLLKEELEKQEADSRENSEFYVPEEFEGHTLQWRYPPQNSAFLLGILFVIFIPVISWQKDREIHRLTIKRKEQLQEVFPEFIGKIILLLDAGLSIRNAMFYIVQDYQKKPCVKKNYLQEELNYICRKMKNGLSEKEGYELLAKRCNLPCYKKLSGMLIQHLQKGGNSILYELRNESLKAGEEEKRRMQKKGEEMGTKLLFPMILMLGIVMIFIMVPALFSFQI